MSRGTSNVFQPLIGINFTSLQLDQSQLREDAGYQHQLLYSIGGASFPAPL